MCANDRSQDCSKYSSHQARIAECHWHRKYSRSERRFQQMCQRVHITVIQLIVNQTQERSPKTLTRLDDRLSVL